MDFTHAVAPKNDFPSNLLKGGTGLEGVPLGGRDEAFGHVALWCAPGTGPTGAVVKYCGLCGGCHGQPRGLPSEARICVGRLPFLDSSNLVVSPKLVA